GMGRGRGAGTATAGLNPRRSAAAPKPASAHSLAARCELYWLQYVDEVRKAATLSSVATVKKRASRWRAANTPITASTVAARCPLFAISTSREAAPIVPSGGRQAWNESVCSMKLCERNGASRTRPVIAAAATNQKTSVWPRAERGAATNKIPPSILGAQANPHATPESAARGRGASHSSAITRHARLSTGSRYGP